MITMSNRNQDYSWHNNDYVFYGDGYNLQQRSAEHLDEIHNSSDDPYVLATLRNVFSQAPNEEYELVYDVVDKPPPYGLQQQQDQQSIQNFQLNHSNPQHDPREDEDHEHEEMDDEEMEEEGRPREVYPCTECNKVYTSERRLKHHLVVHFNKEAYKCPTCGYCYQSPDSLKRHMKKASECNPELINADGVASGSDQPQPQ